MGVVLGPGLGEQRCCGGARARSSCSGARWGASRKASSVVRFSAPVQQWLAIQREVLSERARPPARGRVAAEQAWALLLEGGGAELLLAPDDLAALLELAAICPAFSRDLFRAGGAFDALFSSEEAFDGSAERQQYFRNQLVALAHEKAEVVTEALDVFERTDDEDLDEALAWNAVCNTITKDDPPVSLFCLESEQARELPSYQKGDVFFLRRRAKPLYPVPSTAPPQAAEEAREPIAAVADGLDRVALAIVDVIKAPSDLPVSLLAVTAHQLTASGDAGDACGEEYQVVPSDFLPTVFKRRQDAILKLCGRAPGYSALVQRLIFGELTADAMEPAQGLLKLPAAAADFPHLNSSQRRAVEAAGTRTITLIRGPPGTGKTDVAVAIITAWLAQDPETPILVATGTHTARHLLARRLQAHGLKVSLRSDELLKRPHPADAVPVFVETVYMAAVPSTRTLPRVLIDESSQITESAALVAMGQGCEQLVLIGDPKQLGPVSTLGLGCPDRAPLATERASVFESMLERHPLLREECVQLDLQYRMHPSICKYPSARFYGDALRSDDSTASRGELPQCWFWPEASSSLPVVFIDTAEVDGREEEEVSLGWSTTIANQLEATIVENIVQTLVDARVRPEEIGVATAYGGQRDLLLRRLHGVGTPRGKQRRYSAMMALLRNTVSEQDTPHPRVRTVDGFQGGENDFVIYSAVRSNGEEQTGFVGDERRLCVLLTRARKGLIIVGDSRTLRTSEGWKHWLENAEKYVVDWKAQQSVLHPNGGDEPTGS